MAMPQPVPRWSDRWLEENAWWAGKALDLGLRLILIGLFFYVMLGGSLPEWIVPGTGR